MFTASQIIDSMAVELVRLDLRANGVLIGYLNQTVRELHSHPKEGMPILYESNLVEEQFTVTALPAVWPIPSIARFQDVAAIQNEDNGVTFSRRKPKYISERGPDSYWYRTGGYIALSSTTLGVDSKINLAYYMYAPRFTYYTAAVRPAYFNADTNAWVYLTAVTDEEKEAARNSVSHWMLERWAEVVQEGIRSKVWRRLGETERAKLAYSAYQSARLEILSAESFEMEELP
jgi:hypothetical protein